MITIKNKKDSIIKMKELKLNYFPLDYFSTEDINGIRAFFEKYPAKEYVLRTINKAKGQYFYVYSFQEAVGKLKNFDKELTISVSYNPLNRSSCTFSIAAIIRNFSATSINPSLSAISPNSG